MAHAAPFNHPRHMASLAVMAAGLTLGGRPPLGIVAAFGVYGALHAASLTLSLNRKVTFASKAAFIGCAALLSMACAALGLRGGALLGALPGRAGPCLLLTLSAGLGAACYASLVRRFWVPWLSIPAIMRVSVGCMLITPVAFWLAVVGITGATGLWFALWWWFAFSFGFWLYG